MAELIFMGGSAVLVLVSLVATAVWAVGTIRSHLARLSSQMEHLNAALDRLTGVHDGLRESIQRVDERVTALEFHTGVRSPGGPSDS